MATDDTDLPVDRLTMRECEAMLDEWRRTFPAIAEKQEHDAAVAEGFENWKIMRRYAEKGSALDRASRRWGCAWLILGKRRGNVIMRADTIVAVFVAGALTGGLLVPLPTPERELRCYQGCVDTYRADLTAGAAERLADCTDRCEGE